MTFRENIKSLGDYYFLVCDIVKDIRRNGINPKDLLVNIVRIGVDSLPIILLTAGFTGMVLAMQTAYGLHRFGAKNYIGNVVGLGILRELGPVLTAVMLCGRVGAGIAAEVASMVVTEQVDAIKALGASPITKLVTPRVVAAVIALPLLVVFADVVGIYGGLVVGVLDLKISAFTYYRSILYTILIRDVIEGLAKSSVFGFLLTTIALYKGLRTSGGTEGVGRATTEAVVTSSIMVFISNFFLTKFMMLL